MWCGRSLRELLKRCPRQIAAEIAKDLTAAGAPGWIGSVVAVRRAHLDGDVEQVLRAVMMAVALQLKLQVHNAGLAAEAEPGERRGQLVHAALSPQADSDPAGNAFEHLAANKEVDRVCPLRTFHPFLEWEREDAGVVTEPPVVRFGASESRAVDPRLLACAQSDDRTVIRIRHAVRLSVFQGQSRHDQVRDGALRKLAMGVRSL